jgi:hypothetical protein
MKKDRSRQFFTFAFCLLPFDFQLKNAAVSHQAVRRAAL